MPNGRVRQGVRMLKKMLPMIGLGLIMCARAVSKNLGRQYAGENLVPSGWFIGYSNDALEEASNIISSAAASLINDGKVPSEVSEKLSALVSRDEVVNAMNCYYNQFE